MAILCDSAFEWFCNKKELKFVIFKEESQSSKNPLVYFVLRTQNIISLLLLTNFHVFSEKCPKCQKIGSKLSVKLTAQISNGFKNLFMLKTHCLYRKLWT